MTGADPGPAQVVVDGVEYFLAPDDARVVAMHVPAGFQQYDRLPPTLAQADPTPAGFAAVTDSEQLASTKGHLTAPEWALQVLLLRRGPGVTVPPHLHRPLPEPPANEFAHQVLICQAGLARIGVYTAAGEDLGSIELEPMAIAVLTEGHSVAFLQPGTRLVEVKQGPITSVVAKDKLALGRP